MITGVSAAPINVPVTPKLEVMMAAVAAASPVAAMAAGVMVGSRSFFLLKILLLVRFSTRLRFSPSLYQHLTKLQD